MARVIKHRREKGGISPITEAFKSQLIGRQKLKPNQCLYNCVETRTLTSIRKAVPGRGGIEQAGQ